MHIDAEFNEDGTVRKPGAGLLPQADETARCITLIYRSRGRSYRELPLRLFEFGTVYRYEKSGVVHGLTRVRGMTQDDGAHLLHARADARRTSVAVALRAGSAGRLRPQRLSTSNCPPRTPEKYVGSDEVWDEATAILSEVAEGSGLHLVPDPRRRGVLRPENLGAGQGCTGSQLADVDHSARFQHAGPVRAGVHGRRRFAAASGADPPRRCSVRSNASFGILTEHYAGAFPGLAGTGPGGRNFRFADGHVSYLEGRCRSIEVTRHPG